MAHSLYLHHCIHPCTSTTKSFLFFHGRRECVLFQLSGIYKNVIATDASPEQLAFAQKLPNIRYQHTPSTISAEELARDVAPHGTVDLVIVARAFHWFDHPTFYQRVNLVLKKPNGVLAVWCYTVPRFNDSVDTVFLRLYAESAPYWASARKMVDDEYRSFDFPFESVEGTDHTGPLEFEMKRSMNLDAYLTYILSWSTYQTAHEKGIELLSEEVVEDFKRA
ncbi:uncharacterized protein LOC131249655 [Magnolia sinica]|uniref:uncharacterized protein LOC131249655 n=1 Tax=Magnolia sinica TaxID=86752 RepID=UPI00265A8101|nr:uncharacterized protein LOC131249655 [Magnolia sinica]